MTTTTNSTHCRTVLCTACGRWIMSMPNVAPVEPFVCMWCETPPVSDEIASLKASIDNLRREARQDREQIKEMRNERDRWEALFVRMRESRDLYRAQATAASDGVLMSAPVSVTCSLCKAPFQVYGVEPPLEYVCAACTQASETPDPTQPCDFCGARVLGDGEVLGDGNLMCYRCMLPSARPPGYVLPPLRAVCTHCNNAWMPLTPIAADELSEWPRAAVCPRCNYWGMVL